MKQFKLIDNIAGWFVFVFATIVYFLTAEKSGSFWDCGEFVSGCYKLQVVHPPGAPFFLMLGRLFTLLAGNDVTKVAMWVNFMSGLATAASVMLAYWSITMLVSKVAFADKEYTTAKIVAVVGSGLIAAGCATFLDSLWFSAVEGEVYALSQFFWSFIVWAILKWDQQTEAGNPYADHWLILIAYMTGLSIGVHLLSLLALPFAALVYYYRKYKPTLPGFLIAGIIGFILIGIAMKFVISYTQSFMAGFDKFFVNSLGLPFNSGVAFFIILLIGSLAAGIWYTHQKGFRNANIALLSLAFVYIGYTSYAMVPIRSLANPPINMNRPIDPFSLKSYVDREQYGDRPLLYGPAYNISSYDIIDVKKVGERYYKDEKTHTYKYVGDKIDYVFRDDVMMPFPRMGFWQEESKKSAYRQILQPEIDVVERTPSGFNVVKTFPPGQYEQAEAYANQLSEKNGTRYEVRDHITFADNLRFFFQYQLGYMYFRYLMWNFTGRQNDIQGTVFNDDGGWISGIPFIDKYLKIWGAPKWPQEGLPKVLAENKARNRFYMIPFLLGLGGIVYSYLKHERAFWLIGVLFVVSGIFQIIYQNEPPIEPRERDYAQAGSFVAFCFWVGYGVYGLAELLAKKLSPGLASYAAVGVCLSAPVLMGTQGWDDHNRSGRTTARDFAICYLESCAPNAIIFTQGDNDTYPLWYAQEVEGIRTDVRIINLSLLGVDWYIDQLRYKSNNAPPVKITFTPEQIAASNRDVVRYAPNPQIPATASIDLKRLMQFIASDDPRNKVSTGRGELDSYYPTKNFYLDIDTVKARQMNMVAPDEPLVSRMEWSISNNNLLKNDLLTLDIVANNILERPIYFAVSVAPEAYLGLEKYFQLEGLSYRIVPRLNATGSAYNAPVRTDVMYENMLKKGRVGGIESNPNIYLDENILRMTVNVRSNFGRLAEALLDKGEKEKAIEVLDYSLKMMPVERVPLNVFAFQYPDIYYRAGAKEKGKKVLEGLLAQSRDHLNYYKRVYKFLLEQARTSGDLYYLQQLQQGAFTENRFVREHLYVFQEMNRLARQYEDAEYASKLEKEFEQYRQSFVSL
ncbi:MAG: DUF2723 domain-containing protein [Chitinophagales bacterium]|nr:DUF2723 domain-containing protein [Chitinophagales bacterium]MDW8274488.1 DUF2723 domain-containing protein [Chitinophagales bacterium]